MSCGQACDGCNERAQHHLCSACANEDIDNLKKELREARAIIDHYERKDSPMFQAHLGEAKALMERDEARAEVELDSFEKVAARWERYGSPADAAKAADLAMPLIEALREARQERDVLQAVLNDWQRFGMEREKERDDLREEVERLREVVRKVHAVSEEALSIKATTNWTFGQIANAFREIYRLTKEKAEP